MIEINKCTECKLPFEISWDDCSDTFYEGVEDTDKDPNDFIFSPSPGYCPFCGTHLSYNGEDDISD
jgi:hypothetical protein